MKIQLKKSELNKFWFAAVAVVFSLCLFVVMSYTGYTEEVNKVIGIAIIVLSVYSCYIYRYNIALLIVTLMILYTNYSVVVESCFHPQERLEILFSQFNDIETQGIALMCIYIFEVFLVLFSSKIIKSPHIIEKKSEQFIEQFSSNDLIACGAIFLYALIFFSRFEFGAGILGRASMGGAISEYKVIVEIIGIYYSGKKKHFKYIWTILVGLTSIMTIMGGNRVEMVSNVIVLITFFYSDFFTYKKVFLALPFVVVFLTGIGFLRTNFTFSLDNFLSTWQKMTENKLVNDGAVFGFMPTLATIDLADKIALEEKIEILLAHFYSVFSFGESGDVNRSLINYSMKYYLHYGGFISPAYFYFWFGQLSGIILASVVSIYINIYAKLVTIKICKFSQKTLYIVSIFFMSSVSRWYCYGPMSLFRGVFLCVVVFSVVYVVDYLMLRKVKKEI